MPRRASASTSVLAAIVTIVAGCSSTPVPTAAPARPAAVDGWTAVESGAGDLRLCLPPWLHAFDTSGAVFANEIVLAGGPGLQLLAEGPRTAEPQPASGDDLQRWLESRIDAPDAGASVVRRLDLPGGSAITIERVDRPATPEAWRIVAYAIRTPLGVGFLLLDGPPDAWATHEADAALIPWLLEFGSAAPPCTAQLAA